MEQNNPKENKAFVIAIITIVAGFGILSYFPDKDAVVVPLMSFVLGYYFGSSPGSHSKDQTISDLAKTTTQPKVAPQISGAEKPQTTHEIITG